MVWRLARKLLRGVLWLGSERRLRLNRLVTLLRGRLLVLGGGLLMLCRWRCLICPLLLVRRL